MLELSGLQAGYAGTLVLHGVELSVPEGAITCLMGRNGAGKTTLLRAIMGLVAIGAGQARFAGTDLRALPAHRIPALGIGYVPQGRGLWPGLTVAETLTLGLRARRQDAAARAAARAAALAQFPQLETRMHQRAETLSGGEQQMLAIARALCLSPRLVLLDEPTEGLQPSMVAAIRGAMTRLRDQGCAVLLVEGQIEGALALADRVALLETGRMRELLTAEALRADPAPLRRRLGV